MTFLQSNRLKACLVACMASIATNTLAMLLWDVPRSPLVPRAGVGRTLLWEWTLSRDVNDDNNIRTTADSVADLEAITSITNWETWRPSELPSGIPFRPMVRTPSQLDGKDWDSLLSVLDSQDQKIAHFYNEPDKQDISASEAAKTWREKMLPLRKQHNVTLASPSCVGSESGSQWLDDFMRQLSEDEKPDYLGLHFYTAAGKPSDAEVDAAQDYLTLRHTTHSLPAIITELASTSRNAAEVEDFSRAVGGWLDAQDWVFEYGFFGVSRQPADDFVSPAAQLLDNSGQWTALGRWFVGAEDA